MSWRERKQFIGILALAAALLAVPAGAATRQHSVKASPSGILSQVVTWLQNLAAWLDKKDEGSSIDPDGARPNSGSSIDPDGAKTDAGSSIDPNGAK
ncbi:MAG TPA: hypothetical protein VLX28_25465 [Thermoanaerobaculia bacterium]|nr:hypothetical protein [Thermoanaerobaculia bacterium]